MNPLALIAPPASLPAILIEEIETARDFALNSRAKSTQAEYEKDWRLFEAWCDARGLTSLPAEPASVAMYLGSLATGGLRASTISRRCSSIKYRHRLAGLPSPTDDERVKSTLAGIRRTVTLPGLRKSPATADVTIAMANAAAARGDLKSVRDRALILFAFSSAMRRSEIVALDLSDIEFCDDGVKVHIRRSKGDQESRGQTVAIPRAIGSANCPVRALRTYLDAAGITEGAIWRSIRRGGRLQPNRLSAASVTVLVKHYVGKTGQDPSKFGAHSTRAGAVTTGAMRGASIFKLQELSRHKSMDVLAGYVRNSKLFENHCLAGAL